jgi:hypothetical protein
MEVVSSPQSSIGSSAACTPSRYLGLKTIAHWASSLCNNDHRQDGARFLKKRRGDKELSQAARDIGQCCGKIAAERHRSKTKSMVRFLLIIRSLGETMRLYAVHCLKSFCSACHGIMTSSHQLSIPMSCNC